MGLVLVYNHTFKTSWLHAVCVQDCHRLVSLSFSKLTAIQIKLQHVVQLDKLMSQESAVVVNKRTVHSLKIPISWQLGQF